MIPSGLRYWRLFPLAVLILVGTCSPMGSSVAAQKTGASRGKAGPESGVHAYELAPQALVTFTFDDAGTTVYDAAYPILTARGIPATFFFITSFLTDEWRANLRTLEGHGWEIGSHSRTHRNLIGLSPDEVSAELDQSKSDLEAAGLTVTGFAYPYGAGRDDPAILRQVKRRYAYARGIFPGYNMPIIQKYALKAQSATNATSVETMKSWVDSAIQNRQWLIIVMHNVDDLGGLYSTPPADLAALADYVKSKADAGDIKAVTAQDGVLRSSEPYWTPVHDANYHATDLVIMNDRVLWHLGSDVTDYLYDGYDWVENGKVRYYELNGNYETMSLLSDFSLQSIDSGQATAQFTLSAPEGDARTVSRVSVVLDRPFAEVSVVDFRGTPLKILSGKDLARRFSIVYDSLALDGSMENGLKNYATNSRNVYAFDTVTDLIRIITYLGPELQSEYAGRAYGEFRGKVIDGRAGLPRVSYVGGIRFPTLDLLAEAESGTLIGSAYYTAADASPGAGHTGIVLDGPDAAVKLEIAPPVAGDYMLSMRERGATPRDQYSYQIDSREPVTRTATGTTFGYENIRLQNFPARKHSLTLKSAAGQVVVDYVLLIPISRSAATPDGVEFPYDAAAQTYYSTSLPLLATFVELDR